MATLTLIAAAPFDNPPGVALDSIDLPLLDVPPVRLWIHQYGAYDIYVAGHDDQIPRYYKTLDIPVSDEEYREYLDAVAHVR